MYYMFYTTACGKLIMLFSSIVSHAEKEKSMGYFRGDRG